MQSARTPRTTRAWLRPAALGLAAAAVLAAVVTPQVASAAPKAPSVLTVTRQLDRLAAQAETLTEQYNAARLAVHAQQRALAAARRQQARAEAGYAAARKRFIPLIVAQYENGDFGSVGAMLSSNDPSAYLANLATQDLVDRHWADVLGGLRSSGTAAVQAQAAATALIGAAQQTRDRLAAERQAIRDRTARFQTLLTALTSAQRAAYASRGAPTAAEITAALRTPAPSAAAQKAVDYAVNQIGKPYVWAAAGPDAFDCSGLTMAAWAHAGVQLPHFSVAQYARGRHVGWSQLAPGDLVFLYPDRHHVEMYVGGGLAISAPQEGEPVKFVRVADYRDVFSGATRLP